MAAKSAKRVIAVRTRRVKGAEEVTHLSVAQHSWLTMREVIRAIEDGERFYMEAGGESLLLSVQKDSHGRTALAVGFEPSAELLLTLPRDDG